VVGGVGRSQGSQQTTHQPSANSMRPIFIREARNINERQVRSNEVLYNVELKTANAGAE